MSDLMLFLDTCALLYLGAGSEQLSEHAKRMIDDAGVVFVSPISAWEISLKCIRGKLTLPTDPENWFHGIVKHHHLELYPLTPMVLMAANRLPWHHRDPVDRFIVSSAIEAKATLVTSDDKLQAYDVNIIR